MCVTNTNIMVNADFVLEQRVRISEFLLTFMHYYLGICEKTKY